jgi:hypothetical protein
MCFYDLIFKYRDNFNFTKILRSVVKRNTCVGRILLQILEVVASNLDPSEISHHVY